MGKKIYTLIFCIVLLSCAQTKSSFNRNYIGSKKLFAKISNNEIVIKYDTIVFKEYISKNISLPKAQIDYDKVEIKKQFTIGEEKKIFYYVLLTNFKEKVKTCRWLNKIGDELYFNDDTENHETFELIYLSCIGNQNCNPNVFVVDKKRGWVCGEEIICVKKNDTINRCIVTKSIITP